MGKATSKVEPSPSYISNRDDVVKFMKKKITYTKCNHNKDIPKQEEKVQNVRSCKGGYTKKEHKADKGEAAVSNPKEGKEMSYSADTKKVPTDAFGEIKFAGHGDKFAKYVRVGPDTETETIMELLTEVWGLQKPNLVVSVTGSAQAFKLKARLSKKFREGLIKAVRSTGAWIVTGGTSTGVMKHVGKAVRDYNLTHENGVTCIGIAPWGCLKNREVLINKEGTGCWPAEYDMNDKEVSKEFRESLNQPMEGSKESLLDPNHTHFILVDDGSQHKYGVEIEFRANLEMKFRTCGIPNPVCSHLYDYLPVCLLVLEGGLGTLETVKKSIDNETPVVVIKGSGKIADVLATAVLATASQKEASTKQTGQVLATSSQKDASTKRTSFCIPDDSRKLLQDLIKSKDKEKEKEDLEKYEGWVNDCCSKRNLLSVFELDSKDSAKDVDLAILEALLQAETETRHNLFLALSWNQIDKVKSEILTKNETNQAEIETSQLLGEMLLHAIKMDRPDFVKLFLEKGVKLKDIKIEALHTLYEEVPNKSLYGKLVGIHCTNQETKPLKKRNTVIKVLLKDLYEPKDLAKEADDSLLSEPAQNLFIWSVLTNHFELSKIFWRVNKKCSMAAALFACKLFHAMAKNTSDVEVRRKLEECAKYYEYIATGLVKRCYATSEERTYNLLRLNNPDWGNSSCMIFALQFKIKAFVAETACGNLVKKIWRGRIPEEMEFQFKKDQSEKPSEEPKESKEDVKTPQTKNTCSNTMKGIKYLVDLERFRIAPVVKFILNGLSLIIFLGLYSYILLIQLDGEFHASEPVLIGWVLTMSVEEIRQLPSCSKYSGIKSYFRQKWKIIDAVTMLLFALGMILRFIGQENCLHCLTVARVILSFSFISFCFRLLHMFAISKRLGPMLVMIKGMLYDLMSFLLIILVFVFSFAITSEAILHPNTQLNTKLLYYLPRKAYWMIYGELFLDDLEGTSECTNDPAEYNNYDVVRCPSAVGKYVVPILLGMYMLMTNVLLLNLIIAIFSNTVQRIQMDTNTHWYFQRCNLVFEYCRRPVLPPPLNIFSYIITALCKKMCQDDLMPKEFCFEYDKTKSEEQQEEKALLQWENIIADGFQMPTKISMQNSAENLMMSPEQLENAETKSHVTKEELSKAVESIMEAIKQTHQSPVDNKQGTSTSTKPELPAPEKKKKMKGKMARGKIKSGR